MRLLLEAYVEEEKQCIWVTFKFNDISIAIDLPDKETLKLGVEDLLYEIFGMETDNYEIKYMAKN
jgi:hypothetical protein